MNSKVAILVVDDDPAIQGETASLLESAGYAVERASDGESAMQAAHDHRPDLILLKRKLPDIDGLELCRRIKRDPALATIMIVVVSGSPAEGDPLRDELASGADSVINRPIARRELLARVEACARIAVLNLSLGRQAEELRGNSAVAVRAQAACLNLMEDAVEARDRLAMRNRELQHEIAERQKAEAELRLHTTALTAAANAIVITDRTGLIEWINPAFTTLTGYSAAEAIGRNPRDLIKSGQHDQEFYRRLWDTILAGKVWHGEIVNRRKDGSRYTEEMTVTPVLSRPGEIAHFIAIKLDITARKRTEMELRTSQERLSALTNRLQTVREEEATRIAREIHDELGQQLTGLKMDLRWLEHGLEELRDPRPTALLEKTITATELVDVTIRTVQRIAAELRPAILDKLGLTAALRREASQFQQNTGITCRLMVPEMELRPPAIVGIACFRIFQEAMTNVARHAAATLVEVELQAQRGGLVLEIRDNGKGIPPAVADTGQTLGLLGMRERAHALEGEVTVTARAAGGTVVRLWIPMEGAS